MLESERTRLAGARSVLPQGQSIRRMPENPSTHRLGAPAGSKSNTASQYASSFSIGDDANRTADTSGANSPSPSMAGTPVMLPRSSGGLLAPLGLPGGTFSTHAYQGVSC